MRCLIQYNTIQPSSSMKPYCTSTLQQNINVSIKDIKILFINKNNVLIVVRSNDFLALRQKSNIKTSISGLQISVSDDITNLKVLKLDNIALYCILCVKVLKIEYTTVLTSKLTINILHGSTAYWNSNSHMHILNLVEDILQFKVNIITFLRSSMARFPNN